jgi:hypothetical protein
VENRKESIMRKKHFRNTEADAKNRFQKWVRLRDANENCISCSGNNKTFGMEEHLKAEIYSGVIFNPANCINNAK